MQNTITIGKPSKYIYSHDIEGIDDLEELLISTEYVEYINFERTESGDVLSWILNMGSVWCIIAILNEKIEESIKDGEEMREDEIKLKTLLEDLLQAMQEAEINFIMIDKS